MGSYIVIIYFICFDLISKYFLKDIPLSLFLGISMNMQIAGVWLAFGISMTL